MNFLCNAKLHVLTFYSVLLKQVYKWDTVSAFFGLDSPGYVMTPGPCSGHKWREMLAFSALEQLLLHGMNSSLSICQYLPTTGWILSRGCEPLLLSALEGNRVHSLGWGMTETHTEHRSHRPWLNCSSFCVCILACSHDKGMSYFFKWFLKKYTHIWPSSLSASEKRT